MDIVPKERRSKIMGRIRGKGTGPELAVRKAAFSLGYRYRLYDRRLPGSPDLVFSSRRTVIFVHGCFWHRHENCRYSYTPKSNIEFWSKKFESNVTRDERVRKELEGLGWKVAVIWECETTEPDDLASRLRDILGS